MVRVRTAVLSVAFASGLAGGCSLSERPMFNWFRRDRACDAVGCEAELPCAAGGPVLEAPGPLLTPPPAGATYGPQPAIQQTPPPPLAPPTSYAPTKPK
jgi:hypothetical protein